MAFVKLHLTKAIVNLPLGLLTFTHTCIRLKHRLGNSILLPIKESAEWRVKVSQHELFKNTFRHLLIHKLLYGILGWHECKKELLVCLWFFVGTLHVLTGSETGQSCT